MFHSTALFAAIYADRKREIEQATRNRRLLHGDVEVAASAAPLSSATVAPMSLQRSVSSTALEGRTGSSESACEAA
jgi:hypothetical protein